MIEINGAGQINETEFTDKVDVNYEISLLEYGVLRNPKTTETILGAVSNNNGNYGSFISMDLSFNEIKEILQDMEDDFFKFIGVPKKEVLENLNNEHLANNILDLLTYVGIGIFGIDLWSAEAVVENPIKELV